MLSDTNAIATIGVKNLEKSKEFYERTLGLTKVMENDEVLAFRSGASTLFVYRSPYAGTNKATAVTFVTEDVDDVGPGAKGARSDVRALRLTEDDPTRRYSCSRGDEDRLVQGSRRQYFQCGHASEHSRKRKGG